MWEAGTSIDQNGWTAEFRMIAGPNGQVAIPLPWLQLVQHLWQCDRAHLLPHIE